MNDIKILGDTFEKIKQYLQQNTSQQHSVVNFKSPAELKQLIDFEVKDQASTGDEFLALLDVYLENAVRTGNKQFLNQLYSGFNFPAFIGEICTTLTNTSMYTYEVAPVATLIEMEMIKLMNRYTGYQNGDGTFVTGGSNANMLAMFSARNQLLPDARLIGYDRHAGLTVFINEHAHYSFETAANLLGIGANNVIKVSTDDNGRLRPAALEQAIQASLARGEKPFFVVATCATTLMGAYDPLEQMADICQKYQLWLHADGSFGGSILLSEQHRQLMKGIERTDSLAWNPHKLMNIPLICSALLVKKRGVLEQNITDINTDYIYHDIDEIEDLGKKSIQCGRKVDAVKLWFAWKYFGLQGYQQRINQLITMAEYAEAKVKDNTRMELVAARQSFTLCFRYLPGQQQDINQFNLALRESLRKNGHSIVNYGYIGKRLTIRLVCANGELEKSDIDLFFKNIENAACQLLVAANVS